jgi:hypothetical protein
VDGISDSVCFLLCFFGGGEGKYAAYDFFCVFNGLGTAVDAGWVQRDGGKKACGCCVLLTSTM